MSKIIQKGTLEGIYFQSFKTSVSRFKIKLLDIKIILDFPGELP